MRPHWGRGGALLFTVCIKDEVVVGQGLANETAKYVGNGGYGLRLYATALHADIEGNYVGGNQLLAIRDDRGGGASSSVPLDNFVLQSNAQGLQACSICRCTYMASNVEVDCGKPPAPFGANTTANPNARDFIDDFGPLFPTAFPANTIALRMKVNFSCCTLRPLSSLSQRKKIILEVIYGVLLRANTITLRIKGVNLQAVNWTALKSLANLRLVDFSGNPTLNPLPQGNSFGTGSDFPALTEVYLSATDLGAVTKGSFVGLKDTLEALDLADPAAPPRADDLAMTGFAKLQVVTWYSKSCPKGYGACVSDISFGIATIPCIWGSIISHACSSIQIA